MVANFQDPYGVVTRSKMCMFKRCMCVDQNGDRRVCVPPKPGWMCERKAMLLKMVSSCQGLGLRVTLGGEWRREGCRQGT